jgi:aspartate dehydrogenase
MRVGLIGLGAIARRLIARLGPEDELELVGALVRDVDKPRGQLGVGVCATLADLLSHQPEVVVEAGGHDALRTYGPPILRAGVDLLIVSVGALADPALERTLLDAARRGNSRAVIA